MDGMLPLKEIGPKDGIGVITVRTAEAYQSGLFVLTGENRGATAAHVVDGAIEGAVRLNGVDYPIKSWSEPTWKGGAPEKDFTSCELAWPPPKDIKRWEGTLSPPKKENFEIATQSYGGLKWAVLAPRALDGHTVAAYIPTPLFAALRSLSGLGKTRGYPLMIGDSGGPWIQNGKLVAITVSIVGPQNALTQTAFGAGVWENPAPGWQTMYAGDPSALWVAVFALCFAKWLAGKKKRAEFNKRPKNP